MLHPQFRRLLTALRLATWTLLISTSVSAQVLINELQSDNETTVQDEEGKFEDWVELYNAGGAAVDLAGYGLSDDAAQPLKWTFPSVIIAAGGFVLVWADDDVLDPGLHASFKISKDGESVVLALPDGTIVDASLPIPIPEDVSYGRQPDGTSSWVQFETPTPGAANTEPGLLPAPAPPSVSIAGGFFTAGVDVVVSHTDPGVLLRYTLDGSVPTESSPLYTLPLTIESRVGDPNTISLIPTGDPRWKVPIGEVFKATVLRVGAFLPGAFPSAVATHTYFVDPGMPTRYGIPVISIATDEDNFFDYDDGIYVPGRVWDENFDPDINPVFLDGNYTLGGDDWERPIHLEVFEADGTRQISQDGGVRIHGGFTRVFPQKSLRIYARSSYGDKDIDYAFFGPGYRDEFERLILRNGGQPFFSWRLADVLYHRLVAGAPVDTQPYRPVVVFLNGSYWGIHNARERFDEFYVEHHYGVDPDDLVILVQDRVVSHGEETDNVPWDDMIVFMKNNDLADPINYAIIEEQIDLTSFLHFLVINTISGKSDWVPSTDNERHWRKRTAGFVPGAPLGHDGRWRWVLKDMDRGFASGLNNNKFFSLNTWPAYERLADNPDFRNAFINLIADYLNDRLTPAKQLAELEALIAEIDPWLPEHVDRWQWPRDYDIALDGVRNAIETRPGIVRTQMLEFFALPTMADVELDLSGASDGQVYVETVTVPRSLESWNGIYFRKVPITLRAEPDPGVHFLGWFGESQLGHETELTVDPGFGLALAPSFGFAAGWVANELFIGSQSAQQFIELRTAVDGNPLFAGAELDCGNGVQVTLPSDLPAGTTPTSHILLATAAFAARPGNPTPDYILPEGCLDSTGGVLTLDGREIAVYGTVPTTGGYSWSPEGPAPMSPTNFVGEVGRLPSLSGAAIALLVGVIAVGGVRQLRRHVGPFRRNDT